MQPPLFLRPERTGVFLTSRTLRGVLPCWAVRLEREGVLVTPERSDPNVWAHSVCSGCAQGSARTLKKRNCNSQTARGQVSKRLHCGTRHLGRSLFSYWGSVVEGRTFSMLYIWVLPAAWVFLVFFL